MSLSTLQKENVVVRRQAQPQTREGLRLINRYQVSRQRYRRRWERRMNVVVTVGAAV